MIKIKGRKRGKGVRSMGNKRILFLSEDIGKGHERAARALADGVKEIAADYETLVLNLGETCRPKISQIINKAYLKSLKLQPGLYRKLYKQSTDSKLWALFNLVIKGVYISGLKEIINNCQPDAIVCTHPFPALVTGKLKKMGLTVPMAVCVTDYGLNDSWYVSNADLMLVAAERQKNLAYFKGISYKNIRQTGIPISPEFRKLEELSQGEKIRLKLKLGLSLELPVILVMGGGLGVALEVKQLDSLINSGVPKQMMIIAGKNKELGEKLTGHISGNAGCKILGWVNNIHEYLSVADLLITKPGGVTTAEALALGVPTVMINPLPGQEEENKDFLINNGGGIYYDPRDKADLGSFLDDILSEKEFLMNLQRSAKALGRINAAIEAAKLILALAERHQGRGCYGAASGN
jgi:processive 1,2-diacylglycerol beta-glucosyltransferase